MIALLAAGTISFAVAIFATPAAIKLLRRLNIGQFIREEVEGHNHKKGTPTMGGIVVITAVAAGYFLAHLRLWTPEDGFAFSVRDFNASGLLVLWAVVGMGFIGFLDDYSR